MQYIQQQELREYVRQFCEDIRQSYYIDPKQFELANVKRGLRNSDGTGVMAGVTTIGSVQGYQIVDGAPVPMHGHLYYRGIDLNDIIANHVKNNVLRLRGGQLPFADRETAQPDAAGPVQPRAGGGPEAARRIHRGHDPESAQQERDEQALPRGAGALLL